jgi:hypothetical protein
MQFWFAQQSPIPLALFRILFGWIVVLCLCVHYGSDYQLAFSDHAMVPIETVSNVNWGQQQPMLDVFALLPSGDLWKLGLFVLLCAISFALTLGFFTRTSAFILMLGIISLHRHSGWYFNAGDRYMVLALMLLSMSNAGDVLSIDSILRGLREDWRKVGFKPPESARWVQRMLQMNLCLAYAHSAFSKISGQIWLDGSAVYYSTRFRDFFHWPITFLADTKTGCLLLTWFTVLVEGGFPFLVWVPELTYWVLLCGLILHSNLDLAMNIPNFQWLFVATYVLFVRPSDLSKLMDKIKHRIRRGADVQTVVAFDGDSNSSVKLAGVLQRLDIFGFYRCVDFRDATMQSEFPSGKELRASASGQLVIRNGETWLHGVAAFAQAVNKLPLLWLLWPFFQVPILSLIGTGSFRLCARPIAVFLDRSSPAAAAIPAVSDKQVILRAIAAVAVIVILVNATWAFRQSSWLSWKRKDYFGNLDAQVAQAEERVSAARSLPETDERRLSAEESLADLYCQAVKPDHAGVPGPRLVDAELLYTNLWLTRQKMSKRYDPAFVRIMLKMAAVHRDMGKLSDAVKNYESIRLYESALDPKTDRRAARDLNNLGVIYYLAGLNHTHASEGAEEYSKANEYLTRALRSYSAVCGATSQEVATVLYNQYLVQRELGLRAQADSTKAQADIIFNSIKRFNTAP